MTTDLATFNSVDSAWMEVEHLETAEPMGIHIKLASTDSETYKKQERKNTNKRIKRGMRNMTSEQLEAESLAMLVACTLDWQNVVFQEEELDCTAENVRWLYKEFPWIRKQVDAFMGEASNFLVK